jgi:hypothetical protein
MEVAKLLQAERSKGGSASTVSRSFALELAYILENFGNDGSDETSLLLDLYLRGCRSLMLAVSYAQRTPARSEKLWESLIDYCLSDQHQEPPVQSFAQTAPRKSPGKAGKVDGTLFGSLLEAAALSGADLAHLIRQIPPGMPVEGLRPRLVSAVADSRFKVRMQELARAAAEADRLALARELEHRSRRGVRYRRPDPEGGGGGGFGGGSLRRRLGEAAAATATGSAARSPPQDLVRARAGAAAGAAAPRPDRYRPSLAVPIR